MKVSFLMIALALMAGCSTTAGVGDGRLIGVKIEGKTYQCQADIDGNIDLKVCKEK